MCEREREREREKKKEREKEKGGEGRKTEKVEMERFIKVHKNTIKIDSCMLVRM